ncbi:cupin domain-containing protein [Oxalobacter vibrioformis]|uniref:Cupin domain-containing protein n=1 Tax=Oxalobacter vibrioformis TaxID=933080 RepID=A0A9E9LZV1_9BURK|nr:cupin domain-containing protein [Oxalobacter vibrioformis]WAW10660.1 cupin domain-containing protein [Oxalobacter vibrioformis]
MIWHHQEKKAEEIISHYRLTPHPEGGFYRETYRSSEVIPVHCLPEGFMAARNVCTAILYLLEKNDFSALHRIRQDEMWHFYLGGALHLVMISPEGRFTEVLLGQDITAGEYVQYVVPAGYWFGARPVEGCAFSFVGCTVAPGFDFDDFELGKRAELLDSFPRHKNLIVAYTRQEEGTSSV